MTPGFICVMESTKNTYQRTTKRHVMIHGQYKEGDKHRKRLELKLNREILNQMGSYSVIKRKIMIIIVIYFL